MSNDNRQAPGGRVVAAERFTRAECAAVAAILSGAFMVVLDFFVVIVALPSIQRELGATPAMLGLVVAGYAAAMAAGLVAAGRLGDIFGRKRLLLAGLGLFTAASLGCGLAQSALELVAMRVLQGLAGALIQPQVLALLGGSFSRGQRSRVFAWYAMAMGVAGMTAQMIGGLVIEADTGGLGWRGCFLVNLPIGLAGMLLAALTVKEAPRRRDLSLDLPGAGLVGATLAPLVLALTYGRESGWPAWAVASLLGAAVCAAGFVVRERRRQRAGLAMIPLPLLQAPGFVAGVLAVFVFYAGVASFYFVLGLHLQQGRGLRPWSSGLVFAVLGSAFFVASLLGARVAPALRSACMLGGACVTALGHLWQLVVDQQTLALPWIVPGLLLQGVGVGMVMAPLVAAVLATAPAAEAGVASGLLSTVQQVGNALGVATISAVFSLGTPAALSGFSLSMLYLVAASAMLGVVLWLGPGTRGRNRR